ncbi:MAG TPA: Dna2/Cas4 domain-containing protein [Methanosarcinaceae archaeon]|nr:Dna2/Cas4 domain-containing protein [Methanosarcinaceae archaeon]
MFRQNDEINMNVSELLMYFRCPRQVYYLYRGHELMPDISSRYIESLLIKELAFAYPDIVNACSSNDVDVVEGVVENLETELCRICDNIELIHPGELEGASPELMKDARSAVSECVKEIGTNLMSAISEHGKNELLSCIDPVKTDPILYSERIGLSGMPSKLVCHAENVVPSVIKTGKYPENGVWNNDRLQIAALAMLVEEEYGKTVKYGFVEYAKYGIVRKVIIRANDRRQILKIGNRVKKIKDGTMPDKKESTLCEHCNYSEMCNKCSTKVSLASRFF